MRETIKRYFRKCSHGPLALPTESITLGGIISGILFLPFAIIFAILDLPIL